MKITFDMRLSDSIVECGKSQRAVCADLEKHHNVKIGKDRMSRLCKGSINPTPDEIIAFAQYFGVTSDYLLGLSGTPAGDQSTAAICEATGLSEKAVDHLKEYNALVKQVASRDGAGNQAFGSCTPALLLLLEELIEVGPVFTDFLTASAGDSLQAAVLGKKDADLSEVSLITPETLNAPEIKAPLYKAAAARIVMDAEEKAADRYCSDFKESYLYFCENQEGNE